MLKFIRNLFNNRKQQCNIPVVISSCDLDKKKMALEYIKKLHYGFRDYEYEMAIVKGNWECYFKNDEPYYSDIQQELYFEQQAKYQGAMIVHTQRLPFLGIVEIPTGERMSIPVKNIYITKHEHFMEIVEDFFYRRECRKLRHFNY